MDGDGDADDTVGDARDEPVPCESFEPCPMLRVSACWSPMTSGGSSRMRCDSCGTGLIYGLAPALLPSVAREADSGEAGLETDPAGELCACAALGLLLGRGGGGRPWGPPPQSAPPPALIDPPWFGDPGRGVRMRSSYSSAARRLEEMRSECELEAGEPRAGARAAERRSRSFRSSGRSSVAVVPARDMVRCGWRRVGRGGGRYRLEWVVVAGGDEEEEKGSCGETDELGGGGEDAAY